MAQIKRTFMGLEAITKLVLTVLLNLLFNFVYAKGIIFCVYRLFDVSWADKFGVVFLFILIIKSILYIRVK